MISRNLFLATTNLLSASAFKLLVASYGPDVNTTGSIQTLEFRPNTTSLKVTHTNQDCGLLPSWLDVSHCESGGIITCVNEGSPGSMTMLKAKHDGSLKMLSITSTPAGPVSNGYFGDEGVVALAHYEPPAISTFVMGSNDTYLPLQNFTFNVISPEQNSSHIHQTLLDPTRQYVLFPDLGADLVRVYCIDFQTNTLAEHKPLRSKAGYGPRHAVFWRPKNEPTATFLFVVHELSNKIVSYKVTYQHTGGLDFVEVDEVSTFGNRTIPEGAAAAEIAKSPDNDFVIASNRLGPIFDVANPDPRNSTMIKSDSLITFKPTACGKLEFIGLTASGGLHPRHFSLNEDGSRVAVANQVTKNVVVLSRNTRSGVIGKQVAAAFNLGPGDLTNVQWLTQ